MQDEFDEKPGCRAFYKYSPANIAIETLKSREVWYSSPLAFNDPFDFQSGLHFDFNLDSLHHNVLMRIGELASGQEEPPVKENDAWGKIVLAAREHYPTHGFPLERWKQLTEPSFRELLEVIKKTKSDYQRNWREKLVPGIRVFCVTEDRDNLLMWAHYARNHTGVVFEYWSLPEEDNALSVARKIRYVKTPPSFFTQSEWIDSFVGRGELDEKSLYKRYAYIKSDHWSYEREWRVWYPLSDTTKKYDKVPIRTNELKGLYLGCCIDTEEKNEILKLLKSNFPDARAYQAHKKESSYELIYTEI